MILFIIVFKSFAKPCDILRYGKKRCILKLIDLVYSARKISSSLLDCLPLTGLIITGLIERYLVYNIANIIIEFPIASIPVVGMGFLNFETVSGGTGCGTLRVNSQ